MRKSHHASASAQRRLQQTSRSASDHANLQQNLMPESLASFSEMHCFLKGHATAALVCLSQTQAIGKASSSHHTTVQICWLWNYTGKNKDLTVFLATFLSFPGIWTFYSPRKSLSMLFFKYSGLLEGWIMCFLWFQKTFYWGVHEKGGTKGLNCFRMNTQPAFI